jgi:hypothetical protein
MGYFYFLQTLLIVDRGYGIYIYIYIKLFHFCFLRVMKLCGHISCADSAAVYLGIMSLALNYFSEKENKNNPCQT